MGNLSDAWDNWMDEEEMRGEENLRAFNRRFLDQWEGEHSLCSVDEKTLMRALGGALRASDARMLTIKGRPGKPTPWECALQAFLERLGQEPQEEPEDGWEGIACALEAERDEALKQRDAHRDECNRARGIALKAQRERREAQEERDGFQATLLQGTEYLGLMQPCEELAERHQRCDEDVEAIARAALAAAAEVAVGRLDSGTYREWTQRGTEAALAEARNRQPKHGTWVPFEVGDQFTYPGDDHVYTVESLDLRAHGMIFAVEYAKPLPPLPPAGPDVPRCALAHNHEEYARQGCKFCPRCGAQLKAPEVCDGAKRRCEPVPDPRDSS